MHDSFDSCKQRRRVTKMDGQATMIKFFFAFSIRWPRARLENSYYLFYKTYN